MILYKSDFFGVRTLGYLNGSAAYRAFLPALCSTLLLVLYVYISGSDDGDDETSTTSTGVVTLNPYVLTASVTAFSLLLNLRLNSSYKRYWEAASSVFQMTSKWNDAAVCLACFHRQATMYDSVRPYCFDDQHKADTQAGRTGKDRSRVISTVVVEAAAGGGLQHPPPSSPSPPPGTTAGTALGRLLGRRRRRGGTAMAMAEQQKKKKKKESNHGGEPSEGTDDIGGGLGTTVNAGSTRTSPQPPAVARHTHHRHFTQDWDMNLAITSTPPSSSVSLAGPADVAGNNNNNTINTINHQNAPGGGRRHDHPSKTAGQIVRPRSLHHRIPSVDIPQAGFSVIKSFRPNPSLDWQPQQQQQQQTQHGRHGPLPHRRSLLHPSMTTENNDGAAVRAGHGSDSGCHPKVVSSDDFAIDYHPPAARKAAEQRQQQQQQQQAGGGEGACAVDDDEPVTAPEPETEPSLFLQEAAHLFSLMSAVAMASLRADMEGCASPLVDYVPGRPFPSVNPDEIPPALAFRGHVNNSNRTFPSGLGRAAYFLLGISRSPRQRTIYNASRPFTVLGGISDREVEFLQRARGPEAQMALCALWLKEFITREALAGSVGHVPPTIQVRVHRFLSDGQQQYNQCRKISYIQFPFPHAQLTTFFLFVGLCFFPFLYYSYVSDPVVACLLNFATVACFEGIHEVAHELEDPFYQFPNDIPLNNYQAQFNESLISTLYAGFHPDFARPGRHRPPPPPDARCGGAEPPTAIDRTG